MNRALLGALDANSEIAGKIRSADVSARRALDSIVQTDPDRSMSPLRTGAASGRRVLSQARSLLREACA